MDYYQKVGTNVQVADEQSAVVTKPEPMDLETNGATAKEASTGPKKPWEKPNFTRMKKKKPENKNLRLKKFISPKNAIMCLNELKPALEYKVEQESSGVGQPFCISVEVDGQSYRGYGSSKLLAKQAAAEAALISFVKPPVPKDVEGEQEDKTPWATLASFAVYKLFNDWREGRVGMCQPPSGQFGGGATGGGAASTAAALSNIPIQTFNNYMFPEKDKQSKLSTAALPTSFVSALSESTLTSSLDGPKAVPRRAKAMPENAAAMHPVMLLHQMRPDMQYSHTQGVKDGKPYFVVTGTVDNTSFTGDGTNMKKAKYTMAVSAIRTIFAIESEYIPTQ